MTTGAGRARAHALVDELFGPPDEDGDRAIAVLNAHAAALAWVRTTTGSYPAPAGVAALLHDAAKLLRAGTDDPVEVLSQIAADALAAHRSIT